MNPSCLNYSLTEEERRTFNDTRTKDDMTIRHLWERCDPIRRQLLGAGVNCNGYYSPTDADVPLRTWLKELQPESAV